MECVGLAATMFLGADNTRLPVGSNPAIPRARLAIRSGERLLYVDIQQIDWVEAEGNYVRLHVGEISHLIRDTMHAIEQRLGDRFVRIHRSRIVNAGRVREMRLVHNGDCEAVLHNGRTLGVSRLFRTKLQERLKRS